MDSAEDDQLLAQVRTQSAASLRAIIGGGSDVALLDIPNQQNVGDSLIWAGEIQYLKDLGVRLRYVSDLRSFNIATLRTIMPRGVICLHGGGNFGDLWPGHQEFRDRVARDLTEYKVVQLPQSVHFDNDEQAEISSKSLASHPDLTVLVRDTQSLERMSSQFSQVRTEFCHDMAFGWQAPRQEASFTDPYVLVIARADHETNSKLSTIESDWLPGHTTLVTDWTKEFYPYVHKLKRRALRRALHEQRRLATFDSNAPGFTSATHGIGRYLLHTSNQVNIDGAIRLFAQAKLVVTDRLHAHVLAVLMGIPSIVLDNSYGKVSAIFSDYSGQFSTSHFVNDVDEARSLGLDLMKRC